ncbi:MAG: citrate synthase [Thomasclavelia sp.]|jgi:citrate synthase|nr:citrate synthase [Thomasclavelia sp.]
MEENKKINDFFEKGFDQSIIENKLYQKYNVKNGLRNEDGTGVLVGLTKIADVVGYEYKDGKKVDEYGKLYYRGYKVRDIIQSHKVGDRYIYEEVCFLILFGYLPSKKELKDFITDLSDRYALPENYLETKILGFPSINMMNKLQQEVLMMYSYDDDPDNTNVGPTLQKGLDIIAKIPSIVCYTYRTKKHYFDKESLFIHQIDKDLSIAETILYHLRDDKQFTPVEAYVLDLCLVLHADHGGGNNSTFANIVISSTGTDIYSSIAGAIGSLKGPKHGGANLAVKQQMVAAIEEIGLEASDEQIKEVVRKILDKKFNDNSGLIYGIGHAVYTLSDPRAEVLASCCKRLAKEKNRMNEYTFYTRFANIAIEEIKERKNINVCANIDFYSGLVYDMLGIPEELYTLMFVIGRSVGWIAHNIENKLYSKRIIRPAAKYVGERKKFVPIDDR